MKYLLHYIFHNKTSLKNDSTLTFKVIRSNFLGFVENKFLITLVIVEHQVLFTKFFILKPIVKINSIYQNGRAADKNENTTVMHRKTKAAKLDLFSFKTHSPHDYIVYCLAKFLDWMSNYKVVYKLKLKFFFKNTLKIYWFYK